MSKKVVIELKFLDNILKTLYESKNESMSLYEIFKIFYKVTPQDSENLLINFGVTYPDLETKGLTHKEFFKIHEKLDFKLERLKKALEFLESENMIYKINNKKFRITFKGIVQYTKSFEKEYQKEVSDRFFNKSTVIIGLIIALITSVIGLFIKC